MKELLRSFETQQPEIVFEWKDEYTEAEGWVVINSLRGGAAGGGTRMRKGLNKKEVVSLAKTMEIKFTVSGPSIGGAKSGINFDPDDPRKKEVLERWFKAITPLLKNYYGTGGDLNVDEIADVIPITSQYGLRHPQEGVVTGHCKMEEQGKNQVIQQLRTGVSKILEEESLSPDLNRKYTVADMITGYGVACSVKHQYELHGESINGKRLIIQGWGNVGSAAAFYLSQWGMKLVGIIDRVGGLIRQEGFSHEEVIQLFNRKDGNALSADALLPFETVNEAIWQTEAEVFLPCAASRLVTKDNVDQLIRGGLEIISCGANVPFADPQIFLGPIADETDERVGLIPDFISNCGMARVFAYCMQPNVKLQDHSIFKDVSETIKKALQQVKDRENKKTGLLKTAFSIALEQITENQIQENSCTH